MFSGRNAIFTGLVALLVLVAAGLMATAQPKAPGKVQAKPFKPVQPLVELMDGQKKLYGEIKDGVLDKAWEEAVTSAWILAEIANVNQYQKKDPQYRRLAGRVSADAAALAKILERHDERAAKEAVAKIGRTCKACHDKFRKD